MATPKKSSLKSRRERWPISLLALLIVAAVYAITTWHNSASYQTAPNQKVSNQGQLPVRSQATETVQGQPANSQDLGNSSSTQLQPSTPAQTPPQTSPQDPPPSDLPPNPEPCRNPRSEIACIQY